MTLSVGPVMESVFICICVWHNERDRGNLSLSISKEIVF